MLLGNLKRVIIGRHPATGRSKCAWRYLVEAAFRFDRRYDLHVLLRRLARAMMLSKPCADLFWRATSNFHG